MLPRPCATNTGCCAAWVAGHGRLTLRGVGVFRTMQEFADELGMPFLETSARTADNVEEAFLRVGADLIRLKYVRSPWPLATWGTVVTHAHGSGCGCALRCRREAEDKDDDVVDLDKKAAKKKCCS